MNLLKNKKFWLQLGTIAALLVIVLSFDATAFAQFRAIRELGESVNLPGSGATHGSSTNVYGEGQITGIIFKVIDVVKYLVGTVAIGILIISGFQLVSAGKEVEKISTSQKENIKYAIIALMIVILADVLIKKVFFGQAGEVFESEATAKQFAQEGTKLAEGVYGFATKFIGAVAILVIVGSGIGIAASAGNEETIKKHRNRILWALGGLLMAGTGEFVVKDILFPKQGTVLPDTEKAKVLIVKLTNFVSGFISTIAVISILYAGYLYVTGVTNEENTKKAKTIITSAVIGLVIALGAFAIVNTVVKLEKVSSAPGPLGKPPPGFVEKALPKGLK